MAVVILLLIITYYVDQNNTMTDCLIKVETLTKQLQGAQDEINRLQIMLEKDNIVLGTVYKTFNRDLPILSKEVEVTVYTSRIQETDDSPYITAYNEKVRRGSVAVSRDLLQFFDFGKEIVLENYGIFTVTDVMNKRYKNSVDIWSGDLEAARHHGRQKTTLMWQ